MYKIESELVYCFIMADGIVVNRFSADGFCSDTFFSNFIYFLLCHAIIFPSYSYIEKPRTRAISEHSLAHHFIHTTTIRQPYYTDNLYISPKRCRSTYIQRIIIQHTSILYRSTRTHNVFHVGTSTHCV